jgi:hypothetical protein
LGNLNPKIFTPDWFARNELISSEEAEDAKLEIIHPSVAQFQTDWFSLLVDEQRFQISTLKVPYINVLDLVVKAFGERLFHTPIAKLGINREVHVNLGSEKTRDKIGFALAPPEAWGTWESKIRAGKEGRHGGMTSITMRLQTNPDDRPRGHVDATVQPSKIVSDNRGISIFVNDHYEIEDVQSSTGAAEIIKMLEANFDRSLHRSDDIIDQVLRLKDV